MNWLIFVVISVLSDSTRIFIDNYASDVYFKGKGAVSQKLVHGYAFIVTAITIFAVTRFDISSIEPQVIVLLLLSGIISGFSGIPYFKALEIDNSTNLGIFVQLAPVLYLILGWFWLDQTFSPIQLIAFLIVIAAPLLIVLTTRKKSRKIRLRALFLAFLYVFIGVTGNLVFVAASNIATDSGNPLGFVEEIGIILFSKGLVDIAIVYCNPKLHKRFRTVVLNSRFKVLRPLLSNCIFNVIKEFAYRGALAAAPAVAIASVATDSAEPIVIFFMGLILTLIWPKFGRETLSKKTVLVHLIATVLVVTGIILMQV